MTPVFIDVDNTLLDFDACANQSIEFSCRDFGIPFSQTLIDIFHPHNLSLWHKLERGEMSKSELFDTRFQSLFDMLGIHADGIAFEASFRKYLFDSCIKVDGAEALLKYLKSKYLVCVASNASYEQQSNRLKNAGLFKYVDKLFVSEDIGFPKPQKEFFDACFSRLNGVAPQDVYMIGDSPTADIKGAREYGMKTIWYDHRKENLSIPCDHTVTALSEIPTIL